MSSEPLIRYYGGCRTRLVPPTPEQIAHEARIDMLLHRIFETRPARQSTVMGARLRAADGLRAPAVPASRGPADTVKAAA